MIRPFAKLDFMDLREKCGLVLSCDNPVEVAFPRSLDSPKEFSYQEGVLVNIYGGDENERGFNEYVGSSLVDVARRAEKMRKDYIQGKRNKPWMSDLDSQKVYCESMDSPKDGRFFVFQNGLFYIPHMEILETYPNEIRAERYKEIVTDLSFRTKDARIKRYNAAQIEKYVEDIKRVSA